MYSDEQMTTTHKEQSESNKKNNMPKRQQIESFLNMDEQIKVSMTKRIKKSGDDQAEGPKKDFYRKPSVNIKFEGRIKPPCLTKSDESKRLELMDSELNEMQDEMHINLMMPQKKYSCDFELTPMSSMKLVQPDSNQDVKFINVPEDE